MKLRLKKRGPNYLLRLSVLLFAAIVLVVIAAAQAFGASFRTRNFVVTSKSPELARPAAELLEAYRKKHALDFLGKELPAWKRPCIATVDYGRSLGSGATWFGVDNARWESTGFRMEVKARDWKHIQSTIAHECLHSVFASHFGRRFPRALDEGACSAVEIASEQARLHSVLIECLRTNRGIAFNDLFTDYQYRDDVMPVYAQGHSVARFLMMHEGGKRRYTNFIRAGIIRGRRGAAQLPEWNRAVNQLYGYRDLADLQNSWLGWVRAGSKEPVVAARHRYIDERGWVNTSGQAVAITPGNELRTVYPTRPYAISTDLNAIAAGNGLPGHQSGHVISVAAPLIGSAPRITINQRPPGIVPEVVTPIGRGYDPRPLTGPGDRGIGATSGIGAPGVRSVIDPGLPGVRTTSTINGVNGNCVCVPMASPVVAAPMVCVPMAAPVAIPQVRTIQNPDKEAIIEFFNDAGQLTNTQTLGDGNTVRIRFRDIIGR